MNYDQAKSVVIDIVELSLENKLSVDENFELIGGDNTFDSVNLVEVCLMLEDKANELGFTFDWTSSVTMSRSSSIFRNISALAKEFCDQSEKKD